MTPASELIGGIDGLALIRLSSLGRRCEGAFTATVAEECGLLLRPLAGTVHIASSASAPLEQARSAQTIGAYRPLHAPRLGLLGASVPVMVLVGRLFTVTLQCAAVSRLRIDNYRNDVRRPLIESSLSRSSAVVRLDKLTREGIGLVWDGSGLLRRSAVWCTDGSRRPI